MDQPCMSWRLARSQQIHAVLAHKSATNISSGGRLFGLFAIEISLMPQPCPYDYYASTIGNQVIDVTAALAVSL